MAFSVAHIKGTDIVLTPELETLVETKLSALEKFIGDETDVICNVELAQVTGRNSGNNFRAEVNLTLKGTLYRAEATTDKIEYSIDEVRDELLQELRKANDKSMTRRKRGGALIKKMLLFGREN